MFNPHILRKQEDGQSVTLTDLTNELQFSISWFKFFTQKNKKKKEKEYIIITKYYKTVNCKGGDKKTYLDSEKL